MRWSTSIESAAALDAGAAIALAAHDGSHPVSLRKLIISGKGASVSQQVSVAAYSPVTGGDSSESVLPQNISYDRLISGEVIEGFFVHPNFNTDPAPSGSPVFEVSLDTLGNPVILEWEPGAFALGATESVLNLGLFNSGAAAPLGFVYLVTFEFESLV